MQRLSNLGISVKIWPVPVEVEDPIPFEQDRENASMMPNTQIGSGAFWYEQIKYSKSFRSLHWQMQPCAFLLGEFRFGGDALFWKTSERGGCRLNHPRSLLA